MKKMFNIGDYSFSSKIDYKAVTLILSDEEAGRPVIDIVVRDQVTQKRLYNRVLAYQRLERTDGADMEFEVITKPTTPYAIQLFGNMQNILHTLVGIKLLDELFVMQQLRSDSAIERFLTAALPQHAPSPPAASFEHTLGQQSAFFPAVASESKYLSPEAAAAECLKILEMVRQEQLPTALGIITGEISQHPGLVSGAS